jgi:adenylylsulfate kinase
MQTRSLPLECLELLESQRTMVFWFTGLPASGKSLLADRLTEHLKGLGHGVERLDGDTLRSQFPGTGFTREERIRHIKRAGDIAARLESEGKIVIASFISPYRESRAYVRSVCRRFVEIHVRASLEECEKRDPKGLYRKARSGEIKNFTGLDDPYEPPENPELTIDTERQTVDQSSAQLTAFVDRLLV